jgi:electron transfer flavoprotein beta subunit
MPALITADLRLNEPRYASLPSMMKAKKKPLDLIKADSLAIDIRPRLETLALFEPEQRAAGIRVADVAGLVAKLNAHPGLIQEF